MKDFERRIVDRLEELGARIDEIERELGAPKTADLEDQAVDLEDDEVLEGLERAAAREITLLKSALGRIRDGSFGLCLSCGEPIAEARLEIVPYAPLCRNCAGAGVKS